MKNLHIIMPMAGEGSRFKEAGYIVPKPLIKVDDKELYRRALDSVEAYIDWGVTIKHTFIVRREFIQNYNIDIQIRQVYNDANIVIVDKTTRGALETALLAEPYIDQERDNIMIMDCDIEFYCNQYNAELFNQYCWKEESSEPILLSFYSHDTRYSYAECKSGGDFWAIRTAEKNPISTHALTGCYYFGDADEFVKLGHMLIDDFTNGKVDSKEIYVSLLYNYYFKDGYNIIRLVDFNQHIDKLLSYGTPEEMEFSLNNKFNNIWDKK